MSDNRTIPAQQADTQPGTARVVPDIPGHAVTRLMGRGALASTWLGTQRALERTVAIKVLDLPDEAARQKFETTLRTVARLSHPAIAPIHYVGRTSEGRLFCTGPCLPEDLRTQASLQHKSLRVAELLRTLLVALGHAHRHGIVHGGIKPSNLRVDEHGRILLCDFGMALAAHHAGLPLSSAGAAWMSPEQVRGAAPDAGADLYALAIVAWELLSGALPFDGKDALSIAMAHVQQPVPRLPPMLGAWQAWMDRALAKTPAERFRNAREMAVALAAIDGNHAAELPERPAATSDWRHWVLGGAAVAGLAAIALVGWSLFAQPRPDKPPAANIIGPPPELGHVPAVAASVVAAPAATASLAARAQPFVEQGDSLRARGRLFLPSGDDAVTAYLTALNLDRGNVAAIRGMDAILASQQRDLQAAWHDRDFDRLPQLLAHGELAAAHAGSAARNAWHAARAGLGTAVGEAIVAAADARDTRALDALKPLAASVPARFAAGFDLATAEQRASALHAGDVLRDPAGPSLVYVPATGNAPAFALGRVPVTRAQYAAFARETHRPAAKCVVAYNVFSRLRHLDWQAPGFSQGPDHPVVCVSQQDANAYAAWLAHATGQPYRLPDAGEWARAAQGAPAQAPCRLGDIGGAQHDGGCAGNPAATAPVGQFAASGVGARGMYGNVAEWLAGNAGGRARFRGLSWRSDSKQAPLAPPGETRADLGYDNIGFRVVRVIDAAHPPPPRAAGH